MDPAPLKLVMVQGPRDGETLVFGAGSTVRIGRIVRGNNLTIKDAGISSKHVFIGSEAGQWIIRDLDSSNGTFLNSTKLTPQISYPISHGDTIKIGESTSILVKIEDLDSVKPMTSSDGEGLIEDKSQILKNRRRGRPRKGEALKNEIKSLGIQEAVALTEEEQDPKRELPRVTRSRMNLSVDSTTMGIEVNKIRRGARRGKEPPEIIQSDDDKENVNEDRDQEPPPESAGADDMKENVKKLSIKVDDCREDISENGVPETSDKEEERLDLEKMSLGQWFDYMEVHLQKQIIEETEVLIEGMRQKAERVHAYMVQQKKMRAKVK